MDVTSLKMKQNNLQKEIRTKRRTLGLKNHPGAKTNDAQAYGFNVFQ